MHWVTVFVDVCLMGGLPAIEGIRVALVTVIFHNPGDSLLTESAEVLFEEEDWEDETVWDDGEEELPPLQPDKNKGTIETVKIRNVIPVIFFIN